MIDHVANNTAGEDEMEMFECGIRDDVAFRHLIYTWQKIYERNSPSRPDFARRLRIALRQVLVDKLPLPPRGPVLILGDDLPVRVHTPPHARHEEAQLALLRNEEFFQSPDGAALRRFRRGPRSAEGGGSRHEEPALPEVSPRTGIVHGEGRGGGWGGRDGASRFSGEGQEDVHNWQANGRCRAGGGFALEAAPSQIRIVLAGGKAQGVAPEARAAARVRFEADVCRVEAGGKSKADAFTGAARMPQTEAGQAAPGGRTEADHPLAATRRGSGSIPAHVIDEPRPEADVTQIAGAKRLRAYVTRSPPGRRSAAAAAVVGSAAENDASQVTACAASERTRPDLRRDGPAATRTKKKNSDPLAPSPGVQKVRGAVTAAQTPPGRQSRVVNAQVQGAARSDDGTRHQHARSRAGNHAGQTSHCRPGFAVPVPIVDDAYGESSGTESSGRSASHGPPSSGLTEVTDPHTHRSA